MIKLIGSIFLIISGTGVGNLMYNSFKRKILILKEFKEFVIFSKNEIKYKLSPPQKILYDFNSNELNEYLNKCKSFLKKGEIFQIAWEKSFESNTDVHKIIRNFGKDFGSHNIENQILLCDLTIENLNLNIKNFTKKSENQEKIFLTLGTCAGAILSIIFF
ncbi:MAG: stage III sporulation protein AB [Firmicutes bacterium]|nr:stage III sporulation protein AB [Bacillota bacterium]